MSGRAQGITPELRALAADLLRHLEWLRDSGVREMPPVPPPQARRSAPPPGAPADPRPAAAVAVAGAYSLAGKGCGSDELLAVRRDLGECSRCKLAGGRKTLFFVDGGLGSEAACHRIPVPHPVPGAPGGVRTVATNPFPGKITDVEALRAVHERMKNDLDRMSEMGEMESLRLQMAMDRRSKLMSTLSNLLKKVSDTSAIITGNLK